MRPPSSRRQQSGRCLTAVCSAAATALVAIAVLGNVVLFMQRACDRAVQDADAAAARRFEADFARLQSDLVIAKSQVTTEAPAPARLATPVTRSLRHPGAPLSSVWGGDDSAPVPAKPAALAPPPAPQQPARATSGNAEGGSGDALPIEPAAADPASARALLVICYNRPAYLTRTLAAVLARLPRYNRPHVVISQDGSDAAVTAVIADFKQRFAAAAPDIPFTHWLHPAGSAAVPAGQSQYAGYYHLAQHFGWALGRLFDAGHPFVIVLEDDLEVAVDFFDYFTATEALLAGDESLLAVSAWNDLGQAPLIADPRAVHRSDFFPGLGWMLDRRRWTQELGPKWPTGFWDDWLREPPQRRGRAFLRPEVSRSYTFGESGVSQAQFFARYLATVRLNDVPVDWAAEDLSYLAKGAYDAALLAAVAGAARVDPGDVFGRSCEGGGGAGPPPVLSVLAAPYADEAAYVRLADSFGFLGDLKAGVPRTAYLGVVSVRHRGCRKLFVPAEMLLASRGSGGGSSGRA